MSNAADSAGERWRLMVEEEHAQSESVREQGDAPSDSWVPFAERFRPSLDTRDPIVLRLLREVELAAHRTGRRRRRRACCSSHVYALPIGCRSGALG